MIILTNDDGFDAPGLGLLRQLITGKHVVVAAPARGMSCCGHQISISHPISVEEIEGGLKIDGSPADCVRVALNKFPEATWVVSGVNPGANLGVETYNSGTVAAAREAAIHGRSAVAISVLMNKNQPVVWPDISETVRWVLEQVMRHPVAAGHFWNVNLPPILPGAARPELVFCPLSRDPLDLTFHFETGKAEYKGNYQGRAKTPGTDVHHCFAGRITASLVTV